MWKSMLLGSTAALMLAGSAQAQEVKLPKNLAVSSYDVGSAGYTQAVALGTALGNAYDISMRVLPATSDVARLLPIKQGRVQFGIIGSESFNAAEGTQAFADPEIGPQPLRMLVGSNSDNCFTLGLRGDSGIESVDDLPGKRIAFVAGSPALQSNVAAFLSFGGYTWDDVEKVEVASFAASWQALINNQVDAVTTITTVSFAQQAAAAQGGLKWLPLPKSNTEGWANLKAEKPAFSPKTGTLGANLSKENPLECAGFPFPVLATFPERDSEMVYSLTKAINDQFDAYVNIEPAMVGWAADRQNFEWIIPFHQGAVRFWKEQDVWTDEAQAHNDGLIKRQELLMATWEGLDDKNGWLEARSAALKEAGMITYD